MDRAIPTELFRGIRRWDLVSLAINFIIGGGIFGLPSRVFNISGPYSVIAYVMCAGAVILIVLCFAEVGSRFTQTGGPYLYAREAFGPIVAFEVGWLRWLSGVASSAALGNLFADYLSYMWPAAHAGPCRALTITAVIVALTTVNVLGVRDVAVVSNILALAKLLPLLLFIGVGLFFIHPQSFSAAPWPGFGPLSSSVLLLVYAFTGFESVAIPAGEVQEPQRNVPFALFVAIGATTLIYVLVQVVCVGTLPELAGSARPLADASDRFIGPVGAWLIASGAMASIAGTIHGHILTTPRMLFAMAEKGQLPNTLASVHARFRTPHTSICFSSIVILGCALSGTFIQMAAISVITRLAIYIVTCAALPILRRRRNLGAATFTLPWGLAIPATAIALSGWLLMNSKAREAWTAAMAAGVGLVLYGAQRMRTPAQPAVTNAEEDISN